MRLAAAVAIAIGAGACAAPPAAPVAASGRAVALPNADFEADFPAGGRCAARWACKSHADPNSHRYFLDEATPAQGKRSLCVELVTHEPWALATVVTSDPALRGARLRLSMDVRVDRGNGVGGPWVVVHGPSGNLHHDQRVAKASGRWERMAIEFPVAPSAQMVEVGATLEGAGRVCVDDVRLEIL